MIGVLAAAATALASLQGILDGLQARDAPHGRQVAEAAHASPPLRRRLEVLAGAGQLKDIVVIPNPAAAQPFGGPPVNGEIRLPAGLLDASAAFQQEHHLDPLVFFLGYQSNKISTATELKAADAHALSLAHPVDGPKGRSLDATEAVSASIHAHADDDAKALIVGWDDSFAAALAARGRPATQDEEVQLIRDQPFADLLVRGVTQAGDKLIVLHGPAIAVTPQNIHALAAALIAPAAPPAPQAPPR